MALPQDESDAVLEILTKLYGEWIRSHGKPTEETVEILELILTDMQECDVQVKLVIASIPCGLVTRGKGWFRSCGRALARAVKINGHVFAGCHAAAIGKRKTDILMSFAN